MDKICFSLREYYVSLKHVQTFKKMLKKNNLETSF